VNEERKKKEGEARRGDDCRGDNFHGLRCQESRSISKREGGSIGDQQGGGNVGTGKKKTLGGLDPSCLAYQGPVTPGGKE